MPIDFLRHTLHDILNTKTRPRAINAHQETHSTQETVNLVCFTLYNSFENRIHNFWNKFLLKFNTRGMHGSAAEIICTCLNFLKLV